METSEYETNTLSINNIASVAFRIYEPPPDQSHGFQSSALEIQSSLRDQGKLVSYDADRVGIWIFQIVSKDGASNLVNSAPGSSLEASGYTLGMVEEGTLEPVALQKSRIPGNTTQNAPNNAAPTSSPAEANGRNALISPTQVAGGALPDGGSQSSAQATDMRTPRIVPKIIYEQFMVAVISSIAFAFCSRSMAIPLNYRTMLIPPLQADANERERGSLQADPVVGTFKTYLTTTGSLVVSLTFSYCKNLATVEDVLTGDSSSPSSSVLAAPYGVFATKQNFANGDGSDRSLAQTPNTQALSVRSVPDTNDSQWKHSCLKALEYCGLNPSQFKSSPWVNLLISKPTSQDADGEPKRSRATVPWPGSLCFRKKPLEISTTHRVGDTMLSGHEECHDPLGDARGWFAGASEREERISKRRAERMYAVPKEVNGANPLAQNLNGQSPLTMRRPSTAAAGVMYPTPPDAIQQHIGITPSLDGAISSPNNPPPTLAVVDADITVPTATPMPDAENDTWGGHHEQKRERSDSNAMGDSDDVMNDLGEDVFGDHDVTEDDFNFFDGPDGNDLDMDMPDLQPAPTAPAPQVMPPPVLSHTHTHPHPHPHPHPLPHPHPQPHKVIEPQPEVKPRPKTNDSVFAKPELKHARSSLNEDLNHRIKVERPDTAKRGSSPFDPATVFKRVRASLSSPNKDDFAVQPPRRKSSVFEKVVFDPKIPLINKKYEHGGAFDFSKDQSNGDSRPSAHNLSRDEYLEGQGKLKQTSKSLLGNSLIRSLTGIDASTAHASPQRLNGHDWISEESDLESDGDEISSLSGGPVSPVKSSIKRTVVDDDALSQATTSRETELLDDFTDEQLAIELPKLSKTESPEMLLHRFFLDPEPLNVDVGLSNHDFVEIAQIITEQAATGRLEIGIEHKAESSVSLATMRSHELNIARNSLQLLHDVMPSNLGTPAAVRLKALLEIQDLPLVGQPSRLQPRPIPGRDPNAEQLRANNLYQIPVPHLEVRRSETKLSVLPSSMSFWEGLGLSPSWGTKDISALCIFPGWKGMSDHAESFLGRLKSVYESLKLGTLNNLPLSGDWDDGVLPYEVDRISTSPDATVTGHGSALVESMEVLRSSLSELKSKDKNLVIYFVYSPDNPASIIEACTAFYRCFDEYSDLLAARRESPQNELVLQLVSLDMISSTTSLAIPTPAEMIKLCIETYDRCTLFLDTEFGGPTPAPAVMLEQPPPRMIDFKLTTSPSQSLMHENSCLHVGYAESLDGRWITAAWTDNRGQRQATTSYSITRSRTPDRSVSQHKAAIIAEIWATTLTMISIWKVHWRVIITKSGVMDQREVDWWQAASTLDDKHSFTMIIMSVDTNPSLQLVPPIVKIPHAATSAFYSTPVSTPQANIVSPEQTTTPATPMRDASTLAATPTAEGAAEAEADSFLIDATDQTWGAIVGHRLCNSTTLLEVRPALASGYLIKRTGTKLEDPPVVMEVNLVHTEATPRAYEPLLREMLCYFRGLGTLARARGVVDREMDVRPWHIAAAEKGVRALHLLL